MGLHLHEIHGGGLDLNKRKTGLNVLNCRSQPLTPATPEEEPACRVRLDNVKSRHVASLRCMKESGGLNIRDENNRKRNSSYVWICECDYQVLASPFRKIQFLKDQTLDNKYQTYFHLGAKPIISHQFLLLPIV